MTARLPLGTVVVAAVLVAAAAGQGTVADSQPRSQPDSSGVGVGSIDLTVLSVFGEDRVGRCPFRFRAQVADGRLAITEIDISDSASPACGDFRACRRAGSGGGVANTVPWAGRLDKDGVATVSACFDTCFGRFEGRTPVTLERAPDGTPRRLTVSHATVGLSGLQVSGSWRLNRG